MQQKEQVNSMSTFQSMQMYQMQAHARAVQQAAMVSPFAAPMMMQHNAVAQSQMMHAQAMMNA